MPQAVIGYAAGCGISDISPFIRSLRTQFAGRVILIVDPNPTLVAWLSTYDVETVPAPGRASRWRNPALARRAVFDRILRANTELAGVVETDVRDVVFQIDRIPSDPATRSAGRVPAEAVFRPRLAPAPAGPGFVHRLLGRARLSR